MCSAADESHFLRRFEVKSELAPLIGAVFNVTIDLDGEEGCEEEECREEDVVVGEGARVRPQSLMAAQWEDFTVAAGDAGKASNKAEEAPPADVTPHAKTTATTMSGAPPTIPKDQELLLKLERFSGVAGETFRPFLRPLYSCMVTDTIASDTVISAPARYFADFVALATGLRSPDEGGEMPVGGLNHLVSRYRDLCAPMTAVPGGGQIFKLQVLASGTLGHDVFTGIISAVGAILTIPPDWGFAMSDWTKRLDGLLPQKIGSNGCPEDCAHDLQSGGWKLFV